MPSYFMDGRIKDAVIVTSHHADALKIGRRQVPVVPAWTWLVRASCDSKHHSLGPGSPLRRPSASGLSHNVPVLVDDFAPPDGRYWPAGDGPSLEGRVVRARGIVVRTRGALELRIENHEVGNGASAYDTALRVKAESLRRCTRRDLDEPLL